MPALLPALKQQYLGGLAMLRECIEKCPDDLWLGGEYPRNTWRIAYHTLFYTHLYLMQNEAAFQPWQKHREGATALWDDKDGPAPESVEPYTREEATAYLDHVAAIVPGVIDSLDLDTRDSGFEWYPNTTKLSHQIVSIRHIQGHVGQLSELLMARGIDTDWISGRAGNPATAISEDRNAETPRLRPALREGYHCGLAMLRECVEKCPDDLWSAAKAPERDEERTIVRSYWRIAFHAVYFTHLYLGQNEDAFQPWPGRRVGYFDGMWHKPWDIEPYEFPEDASVHSKQEILEHIGYVDSILEPTIDALDLEADTTGFHWYKNMDKLSHELMNVRHLQGHVGQLSELLMARGIDIEWYP